LEWLGEDICIVLVGWNVLEFAFFGVEKILAVKEANIDMSRAGGGGVSSVDQADGTEVVLVDDGSV
jgi:hypothetical protein